MHPGGAGLSMAANSTVGLGEVVLTHDDGGQGTTQGLSGAMADFPASILPGLEFNLRFGLFHPCEMGLMFPYLRLGAEMRCAILDETRGWFASLAGSVAAAYLPLRGGPWVRAGFDLSRRFKKRFAPLLNLYVTYGPAAHAVTLPGDKVPYEGGAEEGPWAYALRDEVRLEIPVGMAIQVKTKSYSSFGADVFFGVVPHLTLWSGEPASLQCHNCVGVETTGFEEDFGISIVLGYEARSLPGREAFRTTPSPKKRARNMIAGGWGTFGSLYVSGLAYALSLAIMKSDGAWKPAVPLAGPLIMAADLDYDNESDLILLGKASRGPETPIMAAVLMTVWALAQGAGLAMAIYGHVTMQRIKKEEKSQMWRAKPTPVPAGLAW